ncbi:hypothetical protein DER46DRAFT_673386 [Fusarium sp. MPI-SDFR-AT-0072]|nr:hypothetical protein DER46DRAFT_673386 [Fusarium sp. MPI-SDFR-AT-0072]
MSSGERLATSPYRDRKDRNPSAVQGACEWFISHYLYHELLGHEASKILWVSADPGCGKSVLIKHLVDSIIRTTDSQKVCYFFFKDDFADQKSLLSAMSCIIQQHFMQDTTLLSDEILLQFDANGQWITGSFVELNPNTEIICLIDAVDECNEHERNQFFKALCFKPLENLNLPVNHLSGESDAEMRKIVKEIDIAIRERVRIISVQQKLTDDEQGTLVTRLLCVRNRTYLWAHLTLDLIEHELDINKQKIINITSHLPQNLQQHHKSIDDMELEPEDRFRDKIRDIYGLVTVNDSRIFSTRLLRSF